MLGSAALMMLAVMGGCIAIAVPVLITMLPFLCVILGLLVVGVTAFYVLTRLYSGPIISDSGKPMVIKNADIRSYLENSAGKGDMTKHPNYKNFPIKGVYMFTNLGPIALADFSNMENWDEKKHTYEIDMLKCCTFQSGRPQTFGGLVGPMMFTAFVFGANMMRVFRTVKYWNQFQSPTKTALKEGLRIPVVASMNGDAYSKDPEGKMGFTQWFTEREGGRFYDRHTMWSLFKVFDLCKVNHCDWFQFHHYQLYRIVDENGQIDEQHFKMFMEKLGGQDMYYGHEALAPKK